MRRRLLFLSTLAVLALSLTIGIEAALAGNADPQQVTLAVSVAGKGTGRVITGSPYPPGQARLVNCPTICSAQVAVGTRVALRATTAAGSYWAGVDGDCAYARPDPPHKPFPGCTVTLTGDTSVRFIFNLLPCDVPNAKGKTLAAAKTTIWGHHCSVGTVTKVKSSARNRGHVISQSPKAGKQLKKGARVALKIGK